VTVGGPELTGGPEVAGGPELTGGAYLAMITALVARVGAEQADNVARAADLIAGAVAAGGVVQAFGSGHSEALAMEIAGRAGGLVPTNRIALRDLVLYGGEPGGILDDPLLERDPAVAVRLYDLAGVDPRDVFVLASNSGVNGAVVELALLAGRRGHRVVAVTSLAHSGRAAPRHPSGRRLAEIADVVLDNGAPYGDVALAGRIGAVSSVTGAVLAQMLVAEVIGRLDGAGQQPPVYRSTNVPGGHEHNLRLEARYAGRIRRGA
jgi:uncharacterized phosphosugar-binding protein